MQLLLSCLSVMHKGCAWQVRVHHHELCVEKSLFWPTLPVHAQAELLASAFMEVLALQQQLEAGNNRLADVQSAAQRDAAAADDKAALLAEEVARLSAEVQFPVSPFRTSRQVDASTEQHVSCLSWHPN